MPSLDFYKKICYNIYVRKRKEEIKMDERTYTLRLELTDAELGAMMRGLQMLSDFDQNPYLDDEVYETAQSALAKLEEAM